MFYCVSRVVIIWLPTFLLNWLISQSTIYVVDVAGGDKVPRKGDPGIKRSDVLLINKIDLSEAVGADLHVMKRDAAHMRGDGPTVFAAVKHGNGVVAIVQQILQAYQLATGPT